MFLVVIIWAAIVTGLTHTTIVVDECKDKVCTIQVKEIGYEIVKTDK